MSKKSEKRAGNRPSLASELSPFARFGFPILLAALVFLAFAPALDAGFINWDDDTNLTQNYAWRGLTSRHLAWMFSTNWNGPYQPLSWLSYAIDLRLGGLDPSAIAAQAPRFHQTNLVLHALAALAIYAFSVRLFLLARPEWKARAPNAVRFAAFLAAALFAIHPLRVESVAWVTERRDVLSGAWLALALLLWTGYIEKTRERKLGMPEAPGLRIAKPRVALAASLAAGAVVAGFASIDLSASDRLQWGRLGPAGLVLATLALGASTWLAAPSGAGVRYLWVLIAFAAALLSKGLVVVFPLWLLVLDFFPFDRAGAGKPGWVACVLEKAPLFALAVVFGVLAGWGQRGIPGELADWHGHTLGDRAVQALYGLAFYPAKSIAPSGLSPLYGIPDVVSLRDGRFLAAAIAVGLAVAVLVWQRRRAPALVAACLAFGLAIAPVLGLTQAGPQLVADRYSYLSCLPFAVASGAGVLLLGCAAPGLRTPVVGLAFAALGLLVTRTRAQAALWGDSYMLWTHAREIEPGNPVITLNLALAGVERSERERDAVRRRAVLDEAREMLENALQRKKFPRVVAGLAKVHQALWELNPKLNQADATMSVDLMREADASARERGEWNVDYALNLGSALFNAGRTVEAIPELQTFVAARPGHFAGRYNLGFALVHARRFAEARAELEAACALEPGHANAWGNLGLACEGLGDTERARQAFERVLAIDPDHAAAKAHLR